jgi:pyruvate dehydrogenase E1 component alpha subunit
MFEDFDPREGKRVSLLDPAGRLQEDTHGLPLLTDQQAVAAYKAIVLSRHADEWAVSLNRQGRMPTYVPNKGQEANSAGALMALQKDDWFVPAYRELAGMLLRGVPLSQIFLYWHGNEEGSRLPPKDYRMLPLSVPVGSQVLHAVGIAYAERYNRTGRVVITFLGEGGTSQGDFHEACNLAGVWKAGVIFYVQNNQWAISTPRAKQTAAPTVAEKAFAYGFEGVQVDGNDIFAVHAAVSRAAEKARAGGGPTLIEGYTYRLGAHTTADDPSRYRTDAEVSEWLPLDPLPRLERYLLCRKLISEAEARLTAEHAGQAVRAAFEEAERREEPTLEDGFVHLFETMPASLAAQLERRRAP